MRAGFETENRFQIKFVYQLVHRALTILFLDLGQNKLGGVAVVATGNRGLYLYQFSGSIQRHCAISECVKFGVLSELSDVSDVKPVYRRVRCQAKSG